MKLFSKIICAISLLLSFGFAQAIEPIKSGDVLKLKIIPLVSVGQTFSDGAESSDSVSIKIDPTTNERTYTTSKNVVVRKNKLFGTMQRNRYLFAADEVGNILPTNISLGEKWKEVVYFKGVSF